MFHIPAHKQPPRKPELTLGDYIERKQDKKILSREDVLKKAVGAFYGNHGSMQEDINLEEYNDYEMWCYIWKAAQENV
jgi:hypothetical protein